MSNVHTFFDPSHKPSKAFQKSLKREVLNTYYGEEKKEMKKLFKNPFVLIAGSALAAFMVAVGVTVFLLDRGGEQPNQQLASNNAQTSPLTAVTVDPEYDSAAGNSGGAGGVSLMSSSMTLQAEELKPKTYKTVEEGVADAGFQPLVLSAAVDGEQLTEIYSFPALTGTTPALYFSYGNAATKRYEIIQREALENQDPLPPEVKTVELQIMGQTVTATHNQFYDESTPEAELYPGSPRQSLNFTVNGLSIDLSEYGDISLEQLKAIAANLVEM